MNRAKSALIILTGVLAAAGVVLVVVGAVRTRPETLTYGTLTGRSVSDPNYGLIWVGAGLLAWALLAVIITLAASMVCWEIRASFASDATVFETPTPSVKTEPAQAARRPLQPSDLTWGEES